MNLKILLVFGLVCASITQERGVWILNDENFEEALNLQPNLLVNFCVPWSNQCKSIGYEYVKAAEVLENFDPPIKIAKVDITESPKTIAKYRIVGHPVFKYFIGKHPSDYKGPRTEADFVSFVLKKNQPNYSLIENLPDLEANIATNNVTVIFFASKNSEKLENFEFISKSVDEVNFLLSTSTESLEKFNVDDESLILLKNFDEKRADYEGEFENTEIVEFIHKHKKPYVVKFDKETMQTIFFKGNDGLFLFSDDYDRYEKVFKQVAQEFQEKFVFCETDLATADEGRLAGFLGVHPENQPLILILDLKAGAKYKFTGEISVQGLRDFIGNWEKGLVPIYLKSEDLPENDYENNVRVLVASNFKEVVYDDNKHVVVEFYAPWCELCISFIEDYERIAKDFQGNQDFVFAKINAEANEIVGETIAGFPLLSIYPKYEKRQIVYEGQRNYAKVTKFIKKVLRIDDTNDNEESQEKEESQENYENFKAEL